MKGTCRVCGCTDTDPCIDQETGLTCGWASGDHDLCDFCAVLMEDGIAALHRGMFGEDGEEEPEPLIVPVSSYEAQRFIDERRRAMGAGGGR